MRDIGVLARRCLGIGKIFFLDFFLTSGMRILGVSEIHARSDECTPGLV